MRRGLEAAVVFDLDGTLVDTSPDIVGAVETLRSEHGLAPAGAGRVLAMVGEGAPVLVERALADAPTPRDRGAALARFLEIYGGRCTRASRPYPGIEPLLERLAARVPLAVLTNKPEALSRTVLEAVGLAHHFRELIGGDTLKTRKPDPEGLRWLASRFDVPVEEVLLVGDSRVDAETARAAGCRLALVRWGFERPEVLDRYEADLRPETVAALGEWLEGR